MDSQQYKNLEYQLTEQFMPTLNKWHEIRKARIKNSNLPYLQFMYLGNPTKPLRCLITGRYGWASRYDYGNGNIKKSFCLDFNHIRQKSVKKRHSGFSIDKSNNSPSTLFRGIYLTPKKKLSYEQEKKREQTAIEFMCMMPITTEQHSFITQDSAKNDILLTNFPSSTWAWCLQNSQNFSKTKEFLDIKIYDIDYNFIIDHLSNIDYPSIKTRLDLTI